MKKLMIAMTLMAAGCASAPDHRFVIWKQPAIVECQHQGDFLIVCDVEGLRCILPGGGGLHCFKKD